MVVVGRLSWWQSLPEMKFPAELESRRADTRRETSEAVSITFVVRGCILTKEGLNDTYHRSWRTDWACGDYMPTSTAVQSQALGQPPLPLSMRQSVEIHLHGFGAWFWSADVLWSAERRSEGQNLVVLDAGLQMFSTSDRQLDEAL